MTTLLERLRLDTLLDLQLPPWDRRALLAVVEAAQEVVDNGTNPRVYECLYALRDALARLREEQP